MARILDAFSQFFDDAGDPLVDGWLKFVESGTNNTDKTTFKDINETIPNTNPYQLDSSGRLPFSIFGTGSYNVMLFVDQDGSPGEQIQQFDPVGGDLEGTAFSDWNGATIYSTGDIVRGSDGNDYRSINNSNQNNDPTSSPTNWEQLVLGRVWNANVTYSATDSSYGSDGKLYVSLVGSNLNNDPVTDSGSNWDSGSVVSASDKVLLKSGRKNLFINGRFLLNKRVFAGGALTAGVYGFDRWKARTGDANISKSGETITLTSGGVEQVIEAPFLQGKTITVSALNSTGTITGYVDGATTSTSGTLPLTVVLVAGDTGNVTVGVSGSSVTFEGLQIEVSPFSTDFEEMFIPEDILLAGRYYRRLNTRGLDGLASAATTWIFAEPIFPEMRTAPTITLLDTTPNVRQGGANFAGTASTIAGSVSSALGIDVSIDGFTGLTVGQATMGNENTDLVELDAEL